ncbi:MAG TPA: hypothetical protein VGW74_10875, partial [Propionibacteriaceae bacterium]|nr:hypothetical protein [Propionibacteriaceae bacterium]
GAAAAVSAAHQCLVEQECLLLQLAAHWADLHHPDSVAANAGPGRERARRLGGDGTPEVLEFAAAELGARQGTTTGAGRALLADALDLRHRLPQIWTRVLAGGVRVWRARKVAQATRHLSRDAAAQVDVAVAGLIAALPWNRFETLLAAKIIEADPAAAEQRAKMWEVERFVRSGQTSEGGLKLLVARAEAGDVIWFMATVNRIAEILRLEGSADTVDVRRAHAIGILAQPARALELLFAHQGDQVRTDNPDVEPALVEEDEPIDSHSSLLVEEPPVDARRARPTVVLHIHLSEETLLADLAGASCGAGVARIEQVGPVTLGQVRRFLNRAECDVRVLPVIDAADTPPADGYEIPRRIREAVFLQTPASVFPWGTNTSRWMDLDHTVPYRPPARGGPPGQTAMENLGPLSRAEHRLKTHGRWRLRQPAQGLYLWRSPFGATYLVTNAGTQDLGENEFADAVWREADPHRQTAGAAA